MSVNPSTTMDQPSATKRRRTNDMTAEERKEARAHRNRIAAQNSRDRRKAHYTMLERRVSELETENRMLKAQSPSTEIAKENAELKERIKALENGWQTVLTALASQGLSIPTMSSNPSPSPAPATTAPSPPIPSASDSSSNSSTVSPDAVSPQQPSSSDSAVSSFLPLSPVPSHDSHDMDSTTFSPSPLLEMSEFDFQSTPATTGADSPSLAQQQPVDETDSTRHLAAGGFDVLSPGCAPSDPLLLFSVSDPSQVAECDANKAMDSFIQQLMVSAATLQDTAASSNPTTHDQQSLTKKAAALPPPQVSVLPPLGPGDAEMGMQWSSASLAPLTDAPSDFPVSLTFNWPSFDSSAPIPEPNDETMQRLLDTYTTWNSIPV